MTVLPSPTPDFITFQAYTRDAWNRGEFGPHNFACAIICGRNNDVVLRKAQDDLKVDEPHPIIFGNHHWVNTGAENCTLENHTGLPVILRETASNCTVRTNGPVEDRGAGNTIESI
jgi:hypothetical protein